MALIVGSIIGVGIFNLPTSLAAYGPITLISMALTTVGAVALALLFAALSRRLPADGGPYAYARVAASEPPRGKKYLPVRQAAFTGVEAMVGAGSSRCWAGRRGRPGSTAAVVPDRDRAGSALT